MSVESIAREYLESFNRRDWDAMLAMFAPEYTYTGGDGQTQSGPQAGVEVAKTWAAAIPDAKIEIKKIHVAGNTAIVEFQGGGTHSGEAMGIPASGKRVTMPVVTILDIKDGKITAEREWVDMAYFMQQIGAMPEMATA